MPSEWAGPPVSTWRLSILLWASGRGLLPRIIAIADEADQEVTDLSISEPTLETVFINLTGKDLRE